MLKLADITDTIKWISDAIASIINMDVMVCDRELVRIGDSDKEWDPEYIVLSDKTSHMALALNSCAPYVLADVRKSPRCSKCSYVESCNIEAMIIVPIHYMSCVLGGIEVSASSSAMKSELLAKQDSIIDFMQRMADLITSKLLEKRASDKISAIREQLETIIDSIDDAVVAVDGSGHVIYQNINADTMLGGDGSCITEGECGFFYRGLFADLLKIMPFRNKEIFLKQSSLSRISPHHDPLRQNSSLQSAQMQDSSYVQLLVSGKPVKTEDGKIGAILTLKKLSDVVSELNELSLGDSYTSFDDVLGDCPQMRSLKEEGKKIANSQSTILILGESGTGKEIFARAIHKCSGRRDKPFITINCAAIPDNLLESELFGYEDGAFTGARRGGKIGKFQLAEGGSIFLDEIGEMSISLQAKLLRVLQERTIERVGGQTVISIDVRIIAATNRNLEKMIDNGEFREDLYYRLNVIPFSLPPLRERGSDVCKLMHHFLNTYNTKLNKNIKGFSAEAESILLGCAWKGNIRELQNAIEYAVNMEISSYICKGSIPRRLTEYKADSSTDLPITIEDMERELIEKTLRRFSNDVAGKTSAAKSLGIGIATLYRKLKYYGIN